MKHYATVLLAIFAVLWIALAFTPHDRFGWVLENLLVFLVVPALVVRHRRCALGHVSATCVFLFLCLHAVGAHYTYAEVPLGAALEDALDLSRNHYDRIVHFAFGLLVSVPFFEWLSTRGAAASGAPPGPSATRSRLHPDLYAYSLPVVLVVSLSASFEIVEWLVAAVVAPEAGAAYLGTQGDEFDAQKDMALALCGAALAMIGAVVAVRAGRPLHREHCETDPR